MKTNEDCIRIDLLPELWRAIREEEEIGKRMRTGQISYVPKCPSPHIVVVQAIKQTWS